jgi:hypothetical protein
MWQQPKGYIALITVLILGAVTLGLGSTVSLLGIGEAQSSLALTKGEAVQQLVEGCAQDALLKAQQNSKYAGGMIARPGGVGNCIISVAKNGNNWTITATSDRTDYNKTVVVHFTRTTGSPIAIANWQDSLPTPTPTPLSYAVSLSASTTSPLSGQSVTLTATSNYDVSPSSYYIVIKDTTLNTIVTSCNSGTTCSTTVSYSGVAHNYQSYISASDGTNVQAQSSTTTVTWGAAYSISLSASTTTPASGQSVTITATDNQTVTSTGLYIVIWDNTTNMLVGTACSTGTSCTATVSYSSAVTHTYQAYVSNSATSIASYQAQSSTVFVGWVAYTVSLSASTTTPASGQTVTLTATTNQNVSSGSWHIVLWDNTANAIVGTSCGSGTSCTGNVSYATATTHTYQAYVSGSATATTPTQASSTTVSVTWPTPYSVTLSASTTTPPSGQTVTFTATANQSVTAPPYIVIWDTTSNTQVGTGCSSGTSCTATASYTTTTGVTHNYQAYISNAATSISSTVASSTSVSVGWQAYTVSLSASTTTPASGQAVTLTATVNQTVSNTPWYIDIWDNTTNTLVGAGCGSGTSCTASVSYATGTTHIYQAYISGSATAITSTQASSSTVSVTWPVPYSVTLSASTTSPVDGQTVNLTATANQAVTAPPYIVIWDTTTNSIAGAACSSGTSCTVTVEYTTTSGTTQNYVAYISSSASSIASTQAQSSSVSVGWTAYSVSISASTTSPSSGQSVTLTATANQSVSSAPWYIDIWDNTTNSLVGTGCGSGNTCSASVSYATGTTHTYQAYISGSATAITSTQASSGTVSVTWPTPTVTQDGSATTNSGNLVSSLSVSHTTGSHSNELLVVGVVLSSGTSGTPSETVSSITYNGIALNKLTTGDNGYTYTELWYLKAPPAGTYNAVVNLSASKQRVAVGVVTYYNVNQTTPFGTPVVSLVTGGSVSITVSSSTSQLIMDFLGHNTGTANGEIYTPGSGQTALWNLDNGNNLSVSSTKPGQSGSTTLSESSTSSPDNLVYMGIPIN